MHCFGKPKETDHSGAGYGVSQRNYLWPPFSPAALSQVPGAMPLGEAGFPCLSLLSVQGACASHHVHQTQRGKRVRENKFAVLIVVIVPTLLPKSEADSNRLVADHLEVESHDGVTDSELGGRRRSLVLVVVLQSGWLVSSWCLPKPMGATKVRMCLKCWS